MINNWLLIIFPIVLFIFKNLFPLLCEIVFSGKKCNGLKNKILEEFLQFPIDLLFIAISYTVPRIIDVLKDISRFKLQLTSNSSDINQIAEQIDLYNECLGNYVIRCFIMLMLLPAIVILCKYLIKLGDECRILRQILLSLSLFVISIGFVIYSLFLYI